MAGGGSEHLSDKRFVLSTGRAPENSWWLFGQTTHWQQRAAGVKRSLGLLHRALGEGIAKVQHPELRLHFRRRPPTCKALFESRVLNASNQVGATLMFCPRKSGFRSGRTAHGVGGTCPQRDAVRPKSSRQKRPSDTGRDGAKRT